MAKVYDYVLGKFVDAASKSAATGSSYDPTNRAPVVLPSSTTPSTTTTTNNTNSTKPKTTASSSSSTKKTTKSATTITPAEPVEPATPDYSAYMYDASTNQAYQNAMAALDKAKGELPQYAGTYDSQLDALYQQIVGRDKFKYDLNEDMLYQQAADQYQKLGNMAMMDTMGQAAALTGGYGSSYGQSVGQQAYQGYLQQLNDNLPQFYQAALDAYNAEGDQMMTQYGMLGDLANREYSMYQDDLANYWQNVGYLQDVADTEYGRGYESWYNAAQMQSNQYDRLVTMMTTLGYKPTAEELAAAGMSQAQAKSYINYYAKKNKKSSGGGDSRTPAQTVTYDQLYSDAVAAINNGSKQYTDVYKVFDAAAKEGVITEAERQAAMKDIYQVVKNK